VTNSTRDDRPTPGPNELVPTWPEYRQLREAVHAYLDHDPDDPKWADIWRALGAILGEYQRDTFVQAFDADEPAETACVRRLVIGEESVLTPRSNPTTTQLARLTARQPATTPPSGRTVGNRRCTLCTFIGMTPGNDAGGDTVEFYQSLLGERQETISSVSRSRDAGVGGGDVRISKSEQFRERTPVDAHTMNQWEKGECLVVRRGDWWNGKLTYYGDVKSRYL